MVAKQRHGVANGILECMCIYVYIMEEIRQYMMNGDGLPFM